MCLLSAMQKKAKVNQAMSTHEYKDTKLLVSNECLGAMGLQSDETSGVLVVAGLHPALLQPAPDQIVRLGAGGLQSTEISGVLLVAVPHPALLQTTLDQLVWPGAGGCSLVSQLQLVPTLHYCSVARTRLAGVAWCRGGCSLVSQLQLAPNLHYCSVALTRPAGVTGQKGAAVWCPRCSCPPSCTSSARTRLDGVAECKGGLQSGETSGVLVVAGSYPALLLARDCC